jgi:hypothetical protein
MHLEVHWTVALAMIRRLPRNRVAVILFLVSRRLIPVWLCLSAAALELNL